MIHLQKDLKDYTYGELVNHFQASILVSIPAGEYNYEVFKAMDTLLRWKYLQDEK